ncbi:MAG: hypothetical protein QOG29_546, partial [Gaiellaceae bacterium]|nr:hypothetical protein [Gaiellaceae bacterium]
TLGNPTIATVPSSGASSVMAVVEA